MSTKNIIPFSTNIVLLRILEHMSHIKLYTKYSSYIYNYSNIIINKLIFNITCSALSKYKDFLILNEEREFIHRFYSKKELYNRLKKICNFYEKNSRIFPNYIILYENKYIYKNIRKKQKMIYAVNRLKKQNTQKDYEINNNCFDNEIFKGRLFTEEVEYEIERENIINNSNYTNNNENFGDSKFTINSNSFCLKNDNNKYNISFISNNESNGSLYNIMEILNGNKLYVDDLRLLLNNDENINNTNKNNYIKAVDKLKKYEGIRQILIKGNFLGKNINNNDINKEYFKNFNYNIIEDNSNNKKILKKFSSNQFPNLSTISGRIKKTKTKTKNNEVENINDNKAQNNTKDKNNINLNNLRKKIISPENNHKKIKTSKEKILLNNIDDFSHLQIFGGTESGNNHYLLTKTNQNFKQKIQEISKTNTIIKNKNILEKQDKPKIKKLNSNQLNIIKKYIRYKHISQDLCPHPSKSKSKDNSVRKKKLNFCKSLSNNFDKTNTLIKPNKDLNNAKKIERPTLINNQIIIHNNNNYYLTEANNPNLITGTNKNNYDTDDYDTEREKLLTYLKDVIKSKKTRYHRKVNTQEKSNDENFDFTNIITESNINNKRNINNNQKINKINNGKSNKNLLSNQRKGKIIKKNYNFNHITNDSYNYPKIQYNTIRKIENHIRKNSNSTEKYIKSINSVSKLKKYNSNFSIKAEDYFSSNKDISKNDTIKSINFFYNNDNNNKYTKNNKKRNKYELLHKTKTNTTKILKNKKYLQVSDIILTDSSRNILSQRLQKKQSKDLVISLSKDEIKKNKYQNNKILIIDNDNKNFTISSFKTERNKNCIKNKKNEIESYKNKRQNKDMKFNTDLMNNRFVSCDFDVIKNTNNNFSKGLLERINNIKNKINEGIYRNKQSNIIKKEKSYNSHSNPMNWDFSRKKNEIIEKKNIKSKIYENKIISNDKKDKLHEKLLIKVNKTKYFENMKSQLDINTNNRYNNMIYC